MKLKNDYYDIQNRKQKRKLNKAEVDVFRELEFALDPVAYLQHIGLDPFPWQQAVLKDPSTRIVINGARQIGKSTIMSAFVCHHAKYFPGSLCVILAPSKDQAAIDMRKIIEFIAQDPSYPETKHETTEEIELLNGSWIKVVAATDKGARGYSNPDIILLDECSRIPDEVFDAVKPMITNNPLARIIEISTPNGKLGFFYNHYHLDRWSKYLITSPWDVMTDGGTPILFERDTSRKHLLELMELKESDDLKIYVSPRHMNKVEQEENVESMSYMKYRQEFLCEFVDAQDQVFGQDLIRKMFHDDLKDEDPEKPFIEEVAYRQEVDPLVELLRAKEI